MKDINISESITTTKQLQNLIDDNGNISSNYIFSEKQEIEINYPVKFYNNTEITGNNAVFTLMDNAPVTTFANGIPFFGSKYSTGITGMCFHDITIDGNYLNQDGKGAATTVSGADHGKGYHNSIGFGNLKNPIPANLTDSEFYNINFRNSQGDGFRLEGLTNVKIHGITSKRGGHDVIHVSSGQNIEIFDCEVWMRTNNFLRTRSSFDVAAHDNVVHGTSEAYAPAFQIESITKNRYSARISIYDNFIEDTYGPGIWLVGSVTGNKDVSIYNNLITKCGQMPKANKISGVGGIVCDGWDNVRIINNTIDDSYGYGILFGNYLSKSGPTGTKAYLKGNIITNTQKSFYPDTYSGYGVANTLGHYTVTSENNCVYGNKGTYYKVTSSGDVLEDPLYANTSTGDYHLKSRGGRYTSSGYVYDSVSSPCIFPDREIGRYANTKEASIYFPVPSHADPNTIVDNANAIIILCESEDHAKTLLEAIMQAGLLDNEKAVIYTPVKGA